MMAWILGNLLSVFCGDDARFFGVVNKENIVEELKSDFGLTPRKLQPGLLFGLIFFGMQFIRTLPLKWRIGLAHFWQDFPLYPVQILFKGVRSFVLMRAVSQKGLLASIGFGGRSGCGPALNQRGDYSK